MLEGLADPRLRERFSKGAAGAGDEHDHAAGHHGRFEPSAQLRQREAALFLQGDHGAQGGQHQSHVAVSEKGRPPLQSRRQVQSAGVAERAKQGVAGDEENRQNDRQQGFRQPGEYSVFAMEDWA